MQQVRFGIVGVGNMGSAHLSHILSGNVPELKVTAVADINPARLKAAKAAAEKAGQPIEGFPTAAALFESGLCDAVIIATPHYDHPPARDRGARAQSSRHHGKARGCLHQTGA